MSKRKIIALVCTVMVSVSAMAQFTELGFRAGVGPAKINDDILMEKGITGWNFDVYANLTFRDSESALRDVFYLQTGLSLIRRGGIFEQTFSSMHSLREGYYHSWYVQVPILASFKFNMPTIPYLGNELKLHAYLGPAVSVGVFGKARSRRISPTYPQTDVNYDSKENVFDVITRLDVNAIVGLGLSWRNFTIDARYDHGFMVLYDEIDFSDKERKSFSGNNQAFIFSLGYKLPIGEGRTIAIR